MATTRDLMAEIGQIGILKIERTLGIRVKILDARECWGRADLLVTPCDGDGERWVSRDRVFVNGA